MSLPNQFDIFLTPDNFQLAFKRLQTASRNLYKDLYYQDLIIFGLLLDQNINSLINEIRQKIFQPEKSYKIFMPKKDNLVRPLSLLKFKDLIVYQALINVIADAVYDDIAPYYNNILFGNVITTSQESEKNRIFFYKPWKEQWKKFGEKTKEYYDAGYNFLSEFDIASFFDTIDHNILCQILANTYKVEEEILELLSVCLEAWTVDFNHKTFKSKHGIPQGPIGSAFIADLYLLHLDLELKKMSKLDIKYIRYVDDIRIFSKDKIMAQKSIAYLDLLARDLGLIPQGSKILINEITDVNKLLRHQKSKFSAIDREHKKKAGKLKAKTHRKLKKRLIDCFDPNSDEEYLDKTIISFSLYRLNDDAEVKATILANYEKLYTHFPAILFYLRKHFSEDVEIRNWLIYLLNDENLLFHFVVALIFKYFPDLPFMENIHKKYMRENHRHWLVKYFMIHWLYQNGKKEMIFSDLTDNYFLNRELNSFKVKMAEDLTFRKLFTTDLLKDKDSLTALQGLYLYPTLLIDNDDDISEFNEYIQYILANHITDYISYTLKRDFSITTPENFFNRTIWNGEELYQELNNSFFLFNQFKDIDSSKSLLNLNIFNNLVFDKICETLKVNKPSSEYGVNLNANCIANDFPITNRYFTEINEKRNQKTEAHPYDKYGNLRIKIKFNELKGLIRKEIRSLEEICGYTFLKINPTKPSSSRVLVKN